MKNLTKLLDFGSDAICNEFTDLDLLNGRIFEDLVSVLKLKNGFYAFDRSLHVFPSTCRLDKQTFEQWNEPTTWKSYFDFDFGKILFFAEDAFGNQFGVQDQLIIRFDTETCEISESSDSLDGWADRILSDVDYETGANLAREWQHVHGALEGGSRLLPKLPFVLGGEYSAANLHSIDAIEGLRFRAEIYNQIKNTPDGTPVEINIVEN